MSRPVPSEAFWDSPAGSEYAERFLPGDIQRNPALDEPDLLQRIAHWQTANFDPATGRHTLYRGVDAVRVAAANATSKITSRCVEVFGDNDLQTAIDALQQTAQGRMPQYVQNTLAPRIVASEHTITHLEELRHYPDWMDTTQKTRLVAADKRKERSRLDAVIALTEGRVPSEQEAQLLQKAEDLAIARDLGARAYLLAAHEAAQDECPNKTGIIGVDDLLHSSIHLTADRAEATRRASRQAGGLLQIGFEPGSLPAAPERGYIDGAYQTDGIGYGREEEWYGIGQIADSPRISISVHTLS